MVEVEFLTGVSGLTERGARALLQLLLDEQEREAIETAAQKAAA